MLANLISSPPVPARVPPSSPVCNGSGSCSLGFLSVLSWVGVGQDRLGISQAHCPVQNRPLHAGIMPPFAFSGGSFTEMSYFLPVKPC